MNFEIPADLDALRRDVRVVCDVFPGEYWQRLEPDTYPTEFVATLTEKGWLAALIPKRYGGLGLSISHGGAILEEISASGGNAGACHAQMYTMATVLRHGTDEQKERYLTKIAGGELRLQAFAVTEPKAGSDTTMIETRARKVDGGFVVSGHKMWASRAAHTDLMLLLARTQPLDSVKHKTEGLSTFIVDMQQAADSLTIKPIPTMVNHSTTEVYFDDTFIPDDALIGEEGAGFRNILDGMNAERILVSSICMGNGRFFIDKATAYAREREVFGRSIGANQGVQFPIVRAYVALQAADLMRFKAGWRFEQEAPCAAEANMAKLLASEASWQAANACMDTCGGLSFSRACDIERKFREARVHSIAPVSNNLVLSYLGQRVLEMPRTY